MPFKHDPERIKSMQEAYPPGVFVPVKDRVMRYSDATYGDKKDSHHLNSFKDLLSNPFNFYGGFVHLSDEDRYTIVNNQILRDLYDKAKNAEFDLKAVEINNSFLIATEEMQQDKIDKLHAQIAILKEEIEQ